MRGIPFAVIDDLTYDDWSVISTNRFPESDSMSSVEISYDSVECVDDF